MLKIFKQIAKYWPFVIIIFILLIAQAYGDLALPQYTSDIIDSGIQNKGITHILPEKIKSEEYEYAKLFMNKDEVESFEKAYEKDGDIYKRIENSKSELNKLDKDLVMPIIIDLQMEAMDIDTFKKILWSNEQTQPAFAANNIDEKTFMALSLDDINKALQMDLKSFEKEVEDADGNKTKKECIDMRPILAAMISSGNVTDEMNNETRNTFKKMSDTIGDSTLKSMGISWAIEREKEAGIDIDKKQKDYLLSSCFKMIAMALMIAVIVILVSYFAAIVGGRIGRDLREQVFAKVLSFSGGEMDKFSTASLITRNTNDIQQVQMVSTLFLRMLLYAPILGIGGVIKVYKTNSGMGWTIGLAVIVVLIIVGTLMITTLPKFKILQTRVDDVNLAARENLTGISVIRAFGREKKSEEKFDVANVNLTKTQLFVNRAMSIMMPAMMFTMYGINILIIWVASHKIDDGILQVGTMTAFMTYAIQIIMSFLMISIMSIMLPRAGVAAGRIDEVLKTDSSILNPENAKEVDEVKGVLEFKDVHFHYPNANEDVLDGISFVANPGQTTAIIGSTGCGKSTMVNLIPRLYDVTGGAITIDGIDVKDMNLKKLRDEIGFVPQKAVLFSGTIASNLRFGKRDATIEEITNAAEIAQATEFIDAKEDKYESSIAQGGSNVSGGQKQRLSIARAIAKNPKIYVFDDSFSALDMKTDVTLRRELTKKSKDSTVIIVAQRISTIMKADQILVLDDGKIVGKGTHSELLANCEEYMEIAKSQLSEKEIEDSIKEGGNK